jgi:hypothetical protein
MGRKWKNIKMKYGGGIQDSEGNEEGQKGKKTGNNCVSTERGVGIADIPLTLYQLNTSYLRQNPVAKCSEHRKKLSSFNKRRIY